MHGPRRAARLVEALPPNVPSHRRTWTGTSRSRRGAESHDRSPPAPVFSARAATGAGERTDRRPYPVPGAVRVGPASAAGDAVAGEQRGVRVQRGTSRFGRVPGNDVPSDDPTSTLDIANLSHLIMGPVNGESRAGLGMRG
ncbi:hypothetical protein Ate01nite_56370 [Actinoplanes teichomyceticus]|nr:hypothetical protein Ate01nite_56370 [Actinoplanes teichomyceticus]